MFQAFQAIWALLQLLSFAICILKTAIGSMFMNEHTCVLINLIYKHRNWARIGLHPQFIELELSHSFLRFLEICATTRFIPKYFILQEKNKNHSNQAHTTCQKIILNWKPDLPMQRPVSCCYTVLNLYLFLLRLKNQLNSSYFSISPLCQL